MVVNKAKDIISKDDTYHQDPLAEGRYLSHPPPGEEIVISGISGIFPHSKNVHEFRDNLFNKVQMVTTSHRWEAKVAGVPNCSGNIPDADVYDAGFFGVHECQATSLDPLNRLIQQKTVEAIFDAGLQPLDFENTKTGVFIGACFSESEKSWFLDIMMQDSYAFTGQARSMLAQRLGYFLKLKGPAFVTDTACSSSLYAIEHAFRALRSGEIDNAIVGGVNLCSNPYLTLQFARLGVLSHDGQCKTFDKDGNGYARSEAVAVVILQKLKNAKRIYGEIVHVKTNCDGFKDNGITYPSGEAQRRLLTEFYNECQINPSNLSYLEAHGTGTSVGDPEECRAADEALTKGRKTPLLIGSVKSNIGHSEPASGICSIIKCLIGLETGFIAPNINFKTPRKEITAIIEGRLKVVTEKTPLDNQGLVGISSFGFGGGNCHILLRRHNKEKKNGGIPEDDLPRLVCVSGRTREAIITLLNDLKNNKLDAEHIQLLHNAFRNTIPNHPYRGYTIVSKSGEICRFVEYSPSQTSPLCLIFGELNNWFDIGNQLMNLPSFCNSVHKVQKYLQGTGINIVDVLLGKTSEMAKYHILGSVTVQVGLIDTFNIQEIQPVYHCGYSYGELLSAYLDGILTLKEIIDCILVLNQCYNNISTACINSSQNNDIPYSDGKLDSFKVALKSKDLEVKKMLLQGFSKILSAPKLWNRNFSRNRYITAEYIFNVLTNGVPYPFDIVQPGSLVLSIGFAPVDKKYESTKLISLFPEETKNYLVDLLKVFGNLYLNGYNPQLEKLYPKISFPVSRGTRMISPYIEWNNRRRWFIPVLRQDELAKRGSKLFSISVTSDEWSFLDGHVIDGRNLFPATGYLYLAWQMLAILHEAEIEEMSVVFENCKFLRATTVPSKGIFQFEVTIQSDGKFNVAQGDSLVVTGKIRSVPDEINEEKSILGNKIIEDLSLKQKDIYKEMRLRGYNYGKGFRSIQLCNTDASRAFIRWDSNWITFMDNMLQLRILQTDTRLLYVPTYIAKLCIAAPRHLNWIKQHSDCKTVDLPVYCEPLTQNVRCGYIEINDLLASSISRRKDLGLPVLEKYLFVPSFANLELEESVRVNLQILLENTLVYKVKSVELIDKFTPENSEAITPIIQKVLEDQPLVKPFLKIYSETPLEVNVPVELHQKLNSETDNILVIASKMLERPNIIQEALAGLKEAGFIISREAPNFTPPSTFVQPISVVTLHKTILETLVLLKKTTKTTKPQTIRVTSNEFSWIQEVQNIIKKKQNDNVVLYSENEPMSGILGLVNCLRREPGSGNIRCLFLMDETFGFSLENPLIKEQLDKNLAVNVYKSGSWGTYRHLLLERSVKIHSQYCFVNPLLRGDLSSLTWLQGDLTVSKTTQPEQEIVYVNYSALNFRDVLTALGKINADIVTSNRLEQECVQGFEFSGKTQSGNRVMGMNTSRAMATMVVADKYLICNVPDNMTLEEAATIPVVYGTVIYGLLCRNKLKPGQSILIHSGTGGVGQAAITVALHYGCTVFTTVGSQEKRDFLRHNFPQLKDSHIGNSHDLSFEQMIKRETRGRGVDYVLNSLAAEKLLTSVKCLAKGGAFVEIGKTDLANNSELNLMLLKKGVKFDGIVVDQLITESPRNKSQTMKILQDGLRNAWIKPLIRTVFKFNEVEQAFRYMASGKHKGKVLIEVNSEENFSSVTQKMSCYPRFCCDPAKTYVVVGGLGGFGLELVDWLIIRGARKFLLTSRNGITTGYQKFRINIWLSYGITILVSKSDVTTRKGCEQILEEAEEMGTVDSIFNLAVVLEDALFDNQTTESFLTSFGPKAIATHYLDESSRKICPNLRNFVIFSSVTCGRGNAGQTNYGMANSIMERICEKRRQDGFPALAIQWGAIGEVGLVAEMQEENIEMEIGGTLQQKIASCMNVLNTFLTQTNAVIVSSMVVAEKKGGADAAKNLVDSVINILGITDLKTVSLHATLTELGMESITAVEIKTTLEREFEVFLTAKEMRMMTLARLQEIQEDKQKNTEKKNPDNLGFNILKGLSITNYESSDSVQVLKSNISGISKAPTVIFFPGIEGDHIAFDLIASQLRAKVVSMHYPFQSDGEMIQDVVKSFLPYIYQYVSKSEPFLFVAYSYGCLCALEIAHLLENEGYKGSMVFLDGSPALLKQLMSIFDNKEEMQIQLLSIILSLYLTPEEILKNQENIRNCKSWEDKINLGIELIKNRTILEIDLIKDRAQGLYQKMIFIEIYNPSYKTVKTPVRLLRAKETNTFDLGADYQLSSIAENVQVDEVEGNHTTILENEDTISIINSWLLENCESKVEKT